MNIKTSDLQKVVNLAIKGCGQNSQIPLTQLFGLRTVATEEGNYLIVGSTDTINYFYAKTEINSDEAIDVCVNANIFTQLVNKFTTEEVSIVLNDRYISITADGEYKLEIALLEGGNVQTFPKNANLTIEAYPEPIVIDTEKFRNLVNFGKNSLSNMSNEVDLTGYYVDDNSMIAASRNQMTVLNDTLGFTKVLRSSFVDLVCESEEDKIYLYELDDNNFLAIDSIINIYSTANSPVENYPAAAVKKIIDNTKFDLHCTINVEDLANILDRISVVVTKYDADIIDLNILNGALLVSSMKSTGSEILPLEVAGEDEEKLATMNWSGKINCEWLKSQLTTFDKPKVELYIGGKQAIKLVQDNVSKLISLSNNN